MHCHCDQLFFVSLSSVLIKQLKVHCSIMAGTEKSENSNISDCMMGNDQHPFLGVILAYSVRNISYSAVVKK